jgi:hypothetical protein
MATDSSAPLANPAAVAHDYSALPDAETLRRADEKPPLYRAFRGAMYVVYMAVVVWFCLSITVSVWRSVWGDTAPAQATAKP